MILTTSEEFESGKPIQAVVISSKFRDVPAENIVRLKHLNSGHPQTGLDRPSAVICQWKVAVREEDITSYGKRIYGSILEEIIRKSSSASSE